MRERKSVECYVEGLRLTYKYKPVTFNLGSDLSMVLDGETGPRGISPTAADLIDLAAAVFVIERQIRRQNTSPPQHLTLRMQLRNSSAWTDEAVKATTEILRLLGNATWELDLRGGLRTSIPKHEPGSGKGIKQVVLFSGGIDSTCGLATLQDQISITQLVSFYTRQKSLQKVIANDLGFTRLNQWTRKWSGEPGPGHSFYYRSFLFLALGAAIAESWTAKRVVQFENGVLATSIPPSPAWLMTRHAHPRLHKLAGTLFSRLFGGRWKVHNPFLTMTKRGCVQAAVAALGKRKFKDVLNKTETCWYHWSNRVRGGKKKPGIACGICIPCIVRRTAIPEGAFYFDLKKDRVRNQVKQGENFRSYYLFLENVLKTGRSAGRFYALLPAAGRELVDEGSSLSLEQLHELFLAFGREFMETLDSK
jgi:7-cyano-7-deazaguanine synthase in queuosine biosynthesis